jgi:hypothetical protein
LAPNGYNARNFLTDDEGGSLFHPTLPSTPSALESLPQLIAAMSKSHFPEKPWSDNANAPQIPYPLYIAEKSMFAGVLIGAILHGMSTHAVIDPHPHRPFRFIILGTVVVLFFQCMGALLDPVNRTRGGIKWGLVVHTATMFSFATIYIAMNLYLLSIAYVDNRYFPGTGGLTPPGPIGYRYFTFSKPIGILPVVMFLLNNWLADGLLVSFIQDQSPRRQPGSLL